MAKKEQRSSGQYGEVVGQLSRLVEELEGGELPLEEAIERFEAGVGLVKQAEAILADAEKRVERLLSEDGRTEPLKVPAAEAPPAPQKKPAPATPPAAFDDDVPF